MRSNVCEFYNIGKGKIERKTSPLLHYSEITADNIIICKFPPSFLKSTFI